MEDGAARELRPQDLLENVVVKIADEVEVDVSRSAWKIDYPMAIKSALRTEIGGVEIPYVDLKTLIASKQTTREQDLADIVGLRRLLNEHEGNEHSS